MIIFISHITEEATLALTLKEWIESTFLGEISVFVSTGPEDITAGNQWFNTIENALDDTKVLLVLCSKESIVRPWINFEAGAGWIKKNTCNSVMSWWS